MEACQNGALEIKISKRKVWSLLKEQKTSGYLSPQNVLHWCTNVLPLLYYFCKHGGLTGTETNKFGGPCSDKTGMGNSTTLFCLQEPKTTLMVANHNGLWKLQSKKPAGPKAASSRLRYTLKLCTQCCLPLRPQAGGNLLVDSSHPCLTIIPSNTQLLKAYGLLTPERKGFF